MEIQSSINEIAQNASKAFQTFRHTSFEKRLQLAHKIAELIDKYSTDLVRTAHEETHLSPTRLKNELNRCQHQFISYAAYYQSPNRCFPSISTTQKDIRKMFLPIGPIVVYGSSNFPFAYSTLGGDVASALAAGCCVIVKIHEGHPKTAKLSGEIIQEALKAVDLDPNILQQIELPNREDGQWLIQNPIVQAVGFTGSLIGGMQLYRWAQERTQPIPVFSEMGSVNPVFIFPDVSNDDVKSIASKLTISLTQDAGQFCTKPGIILGVEGETWNTFQTHLIEGVDKAGTFELLHNGITQQFGYHSKERINSGVQILTKEDSEHIKGIIHLTDFENFIKNPTLQEEIFGPYTILVTCKDAKDFFRTNEWLKGQLTCSIFTHRHDVEVKSFLEQLHLYCGRLIINDVPTGVEVNDPMMHGGPFPASTDPRFTAVGHDAVGRFLRPVTYQNVPNELLPELLKNENPLQLIRAINGKFTKDIL